MRKLTLAGAVVMFGLLNITDHQLVIYLNRWLWLLAAFGWGYQLLNRPMRWLPYATQAVFPWYILHQTITVVAGYELSRFELGPVVEPLLVLGITIGGCLFLYEFVIRRVPLLRPLFGLPYRERPAGSTGQIRRSDQAPALGVVAPAE